MSDAPMTMTKDQEAMCRAIAEKGSDLHSAQDEHSCPLDRMALVHAVRQLREELDASRRLVAIVQQGRDQMTERVRAYETQIRDADYPTPSPTAGERYE